MMQGAPRMAGDPGGAGGVPTAGRGSRLLVPRLALLVPGVLLLGLFLVPLLAMLAVSFFRRVQSAFFEPGFTLQNYGLALQPFFLERLVVSLALAALAAAICVLVAFPFCYGLTRMPRRRQVPFLVLILAVLTLSEVISAFAFSLLLSRTSGISNVLVWGGLLPAPVALTPGFGAVLAGFVFIAFPLSVLTLFPTLSRLNPELVEAATTLGASPTRAFLSVVVPVMRPAILGTFTLGFVYVLGSYLVPQVLGRPAQWTLPVHITDQAILKSNLPLAAALAMILLAASALVSVALLRFGAARQRGAP